MYNMNLEFIDCSVEVKQEHADEEIDSLRLEEVDCESYDAQEGNKLKQELGTPSDDDSHDEPEAKQLKQGKSGTTTTVTKGKDKQNTEKLCAIKTGNEENENKITDTYTCGCCGIVFAIKSYYESHSRQCESKYLCKLGKNDVVSIQIEDKKHKCSACKYQTNVASNMKIHSVVHSKERLFNCVHCDFTSLQYSSLYRHNKVKHSGAKELKCDQCDYTCIRLPSLRRHQLVHAAIKPFLCEVCHRSFSTNRYLRSHMYKHNGQEKPHKCGECDYASVQEGDLQKHRRQRHTKHKPYACKLCDYRSATSSDMNSHSYTHDKVKPHKCPECPLRFVAPSKLRIHIAKKHRELLIKSEKS